MAKTKQDNNMIECLGVVYAETETKLSGPIKRGVVCYQNQIEKQHDKLYKSDLHWKWSWVVLTDRTECGLWQKKKRKNNDMIDRIGAVYA